jgi:hypothetical protein
MRVALLRACTPRCLPLQDHQQLAELRQLGLAGALPQLLDSPCGLGCLMRQEPMLGCW